MKEEHEWVTQHEDHSKPGKITRYVECSKCPAATAFEILQVGRGGAFDFKLEYKIVGYELPEGADEDHCPSA